MTNRCSQILVGFFAGCGALLWVGCDYCRAGRYQLTYQPPQRLETATAISVTHGNHVAELLQSALHDRGFIQLRPDFWTRRGADVSWQTNAQGELMLCVSAFGAKREVRESEQVELELIRFLLSRPGVSVSPVELRGQGAPE
jgi:hypothetical protein